MGDQAISLFENRRTASAKFQVRFPYLEPLACWDSQERG